MSDVFLSSDELSRFTGYPANQRVRTCRWLEKRGIKYDTNRLGEPVVLRSVFDSQAQQVEGPDLSWLESA